MQREGGPIEEIRPGDVVWFPPGEKHWHGATPTTAMTHIAVQEALDGKAVEWLEHVTDEHMAPERARRATLGSSNSRPKRQNATPANAELLLRAFLITLGLIGPAWHKSAF